MREFLMVMKALSDPNRVKIIKMLQRKVMCVCEIQTALGMAQSTTSKHLKILEGAGLIDSHKDGLWVNYMPADGGQSPYAASLIGHMRHWLDDEPDIAETTKKLARIDRFKILGKR